MSIIIKGMNMPSSCMECPFSDHEAWCMILCDWMDRYYCPDDEIPDDCPLVEIPKGARLIDGNALVDSLGISDRDDYCEEIIDEAPTIFEEDDE